MPGGSAISPSRIERLGDFCLRRGQDGDCRARSKAYSDSFATRERLAKADPGNAGWQRDLSVSLNKLGNVLQAQGNLVDALHRYGNPMPSPNAWRPPSQRTPDGNANCPSRI